MFDMLITANQKGFVEYLSKKNQTVINGKQTFNNLLCPSKNSTMQRGAKSSFDNVQEAVNNSFT